MLIRLMPALAEPRPGAFQVRQCVIQTKGRMAWQKTVGYGRRSHAETAMLRYKAIIGGSLRARTLPAQKTETKVGCAVLNRMARLGMPVSQRVR